jgi:hypothetical protein
MAKQDWNNKSGFEKTKDEMFELMLAEAGTKPTSKALPEKENKWKERAGFDKTKDQIAELMILESSRNRKTESKSDGFVDNSQNIELMRVRGTAFLEAQERRNRQQAHQDTELSKKYEEKDFTDSKMARDMCFGTFESPLEVQARRTSIKSVERKGRTEEIFHKAGTAYLGKFNLIDMQDKEKLDLEVSKALNAEVHFRNLGYKIDFN